MRQRRLERCLIRAEAALEAGEEAAARDAIDEAKQLDHNSPDLETIRASLEQRRLAAAAAAAVEMAEIADAAQRQHRQRTRRAVVAAGLGLTLFGGSAAIIYRAAGESKAGMSRDTQLALTAPLPGSQKSSAPQKLPAPSASARTDVPQSAFTDAPAVPQPSRPEPGGGELERPARSSPSDQPIAGPSVAAPAIPLRAGDAVLARNTVVQDAPSVTRMETPPVTATPLASAPGDVADVPPPPAAPVLEERPRAVPPLASAPEAPAPVATSAPTAAPAPASVPDEASRVRSVLSQYEVAYSQLNARAAQAIWPGVDGRSLARAFQSLESQRVSLGQCALAIDGGTARADCDGSATWTPKIGGGTRTEARHWKFELQNAGGTWQIVTAAARTP